MQIDSDKEDDDSDVAAPEYSHSGNLSVWVLLWLPKHPNSYCEDFLVELVINLQYFLLSFVKRHS